MLHARISISYYFSLICIDFSSHHTGSYRANLMVSSSVEQSNSSSNSELGAGQQIHHAKLPTNHVYANAEVSQVGDFRPFTPIYMNSDDESMRELLSERSSHHDSRSREGRGWSVGSTHGDRIHRHHGGRGLSASSSHTDRICAHQARDGRCWSAGPSQLSKVHSKQPREGRGSSVDPAMMDRVHSQQDRERRGCSVGHDDKIQTTREKRGASVGPTQADRLHSQQVRKKRGQSFGPQDQVQSPREERALPTTPSHENKQTDFEAMRHKRAGRAKSVSATTKHKIDHSATQLPRPRSYSSNLSTVLTKPLPLPPFSVPPPAPLLRRSNPQLSNRLVSPPTHTPPHPVEDIAAHKSNHTKIEASGDYSTPVPVSERYKYDPNFRQDPANMQRQSFIIDTSHDYSDLDEPEDETGEGTVGDRYDHLTPPEVEVHPETHCQGLAELNGLNDEPEEEYSSGYVPNEVSFVALL